MTKTGDNPNSTTRPLGPQGHLATSLTLSRRIRYYVSRVLFSTIVALITVRWLIGPLVRRMTDHRRVLLPVTSRLMAQYAKTFHQLIASDNRISLTISSNARGESVARAFAESEGLVFIKERFARYRWWDLILFTDHWWSRPFHRRIPTIFTQHGIPNYKFYKGKEYVYGYSIVDDKPRYTTIFDASEANRENAVARYPLLEDHIKIVGDLRADAMLELVTKRSSIRQELGFCDQDTVVLFMSTWSADCLMDRCGPALFDQAGDLMEQGRYKVIIGSHPHLWRQDDPSKKYWGDYLLSQRQRGFVVMLPDQDWEPFLVACDLAVSDHTSLALYYALLAKPIIFLESAEKNLHPMSIQRRLMEVCPRLTSPQDLGQQLDQARHSFAFDKLNEAAQAICSCPGQAAGRITKEIYHILELATQ